MSLKLLVGLGNPGERYRFTRHNVGFMVLDRLGGARWKPGYEGRWKEICLAQQPVILLRPETFMNRSGRSVLRASARGIAPEELLVICDDLDLPLGRIRIRPSGGNGGHRGLASVAESLSSTEFPRLRIGIGRPPDKMEAADYVLEPFDPTEQAVLADVLDLCVRAVELMMISGVEAAMNEFNGWDLTPSDL